MPPITRSDFPYPLRTIDGEVDCIVDDLVTTDLDVTGTATINNLFVSGVTSIPGGVIDLADITCDSLVVQTTTQLNTLNVSGASVLSGVSCQGLTGTTLNSSGNVNAVSGVITGNSVVATTSVSGATVTATGLVSGANVTATNAVNGASVSATGAVSGATVSATGLVSGASVNVSGLTASQSVQTDGSKNLVSLANTGSGLNVLQTSPSLVTPNIGAASGTSLSLSTPLGVSSGGTGQTSLASVQVGTASVAVNLNGGSVGQVPYQNGVSSTGFIPTQTAGTVLTSNGVGVQPTFQTPQVGTVGGVLPVANGGTGVTTSTGTGSTVLSNNANLVLPNIGAASGASLNLNGGVESTSFTTGTAVITGGLGVSGNIWINNGGINGGVNSNIGGGILNGQFVVANGNQNATDVNTGALHVSSGGLGVGLDTFVGGHVTSDNGDNANSASTGAVRVPNGGLGVGRDIWGGARVIANSTADGPAAFDPYSLQTEGGCLVKKSLRVVQGPINAGGADADFLSVDVFSTTQAANGVIGSITTLGGVYVQRDLICQGKVIANTLSIGGIDVPFAQGSWTPLYTTFKEDSPGSNTYTLTPWVSPTVITNTGYFTKIGKMVTITWNISIEVDGVGNNGVGVGAATRFPAITQLPYPNNDTLVQSSDITGSFPNGYINANPTPLTTLMGLPYTSVFPLASSYQVQYPPLYPNNGSFALDGSTIVFECDQSYWIPGALTWEGPGTLWNANMDPIIQNYKLATSGSLTYFT